MLLRRRTAAPETRVREKIDQILSGELLPQLPRIFIDIDQFERAFRRYWPFPRAWWNPPAKWFNPILATEQTGGVFTNKVERMAAAFRDRVMFEEISRHVSGGERVFAVVGRGHLPMQASALRCALGAES